MKTRLIMTFKDTVLLRAISVFLAVSIPLFSLLGHMYFTQRGSLVNLSLVGDSMTKSVKDFGNYVKSKLGRADGVDDGSANPKTVGDPKPSSFASLLTPLFSEAVSVEVVSKNFQISTKLDPVGVADSGALETPVEWSKGGWFKSGARPGEVGNVLINAHYDDSLGRPAAFWQLKNVREGDKVFLQDALGKKFEYKVVKVFYVSINDPNRAQIFKGSDEPKALATLITCGGVWLLGQQNYNMRLVVQAELVS